MTKQKKIIKCGKEYLKNSTLAESTIYWRMLHCRKAVKVRIDSTIEDWYNGCISDSDSDESGSTPESSTSSYGEMDITWGYEPSVACSIRASCASWDWYIGSTQGCDPWRLSSTLRSRPICSMSPSNNSQFATLSQWKFQCNPGQRRNQSSSLFRSLSFQAHLVLI